MTFQVIVRIHALCLAAILGFVATSPNVLADPAKDFQKAIQKNDVPKAVSAIKSGADPNRMVAFKHPEVNRGRPFWEIPIVLASFVGNWDMAEALFANGTTARRFDALRSICFAVRDNNEDMVKKFLELGIVPNPIGKCRAGRGSPRISPLALAKQTGTASIIDMIVSAGGQDDYGDPGLTKKLEAALKSDNAGAVTKALDEGVDPNQMVFIEERGFAGGRRVLIRPLRYAARNGNPHAISALLSRGANTSGMDGSDVICMAAWRGQPEAIQLILDAGVDPNPPNKCFAGRGGRVSPLARAKQLRHKEAAQLISAAGGKAKY